MMTPTDWYVAAHIFLIAVALAVLAVSELVITP